MVAAGVRQVSQTLRYPRWLPLTESPADDLGGLALTVSTAVRLRGTRTDSFHLAALDNPKTVGSSDLAEYVVHVVFYRLF